MMNPSEFKASLSKSVPPASVSSPLTALWHDGKGNWGAAHDTLQNEETPDGAWVHAYLHRKEGDTANAGYWYRRAGKPAASGSLDAEWEAIVTFLLTQPL